MSRSLPPSRLLRDRRIGFWQHGIPLQSPVEYPNHKAARLHRRWRHTHGPCAHKQTEIPSELQRLEHPDPWHGYCKRRGRRSPSARISWPSCQILGQERRWIFERIPILGLIRRPPLCYGCPQKAAGENGPCFRKERGRPEQRSRCCVVSVPVLENGRSFFNAPKSYEGGVVFGRPPHTQMLVPVTSSRTKPCRPSRQCPCSPTCEGGYNGPAWVTGPSSRPVPRTSGASCCPPVPR